MIKNLLFALLVLPRLVSGQKEIETVAKINFVTVYTSAAELSCEKEILLHKGKTIVVFTDLTPFIVENSINVSIANPNVTIITVADRINYTKEKRHVNEKVVNYKDSIIRMKKQIALMNVRSEVVNMEKKFTGDALNAISTRAVSVAEIEKGSILLNKHYYDLTKEVHSLEERTSELEERITRYENELQQAVTVTVKTMSEIRVTVNCNAEEKVKFKFKFLTGKAGWAPVYDFKYEGPEKPLQFVFRANVFNASGTPWQDVAMKLSTADPVHGFSLPSLDQKNIETKSDKNVKFNKIELVNAITEYSISQEYNIPSDAKPYAIDVTANAIPANYNYLLMPNVDPFGFLMAKIPAWNTYNLIPGTTNIYNMGTYMGKTFLDTYSDNDTLSLYLGKDKNIQAVRNEKTIDHKRFFVGNFSVEETFVDIAIKNNSPYTLPVEMLDQVPIFTKDDKEKMTVDIGNANYDRTEGILTWYLPVKSNENIAIHYKYEIKTPKENYDNYGRPKKRKFRTISCPAF